MGLAIIGLTLLIRLILYPLFYKSIKNQTILQKLQPHIQKIQLDHKDNKEKQAQALMQLYKDHQVNPFSGIFLLILQLPILIALYQVFLYGFKDESLTGLYSFITSPTHINPSFLGLIDLAKSSIIVVSLAAVLQYLQAKLSLPKDESGKEVAGAKLAKQMSFIGPALTFAILYSMPAAVGLYWMTTSVFSIFQQMYVNKILKKQGIK